MDFVNNDMLLVGSLASYEQLDYVNDDIALGTLGLPSALLSSSSSASYPASNSKVTQQMFEQLLHCHKVGVIFALNVILDPLLEEGYKALEEYFERTEHIKMKDSENN